MLDYYSYGIVFGGLLFIVLVCSYACCKLKQGIDDMEAMNVVKELRENPTLYSEHPSQRNIESSVTDNSGYHSNASDSGAANNFLPYPNSGTSYQAPCTNPV